MKRNLTLLILLNIVFVFGASAIDKKVRTSDGVDLFVTVKGEGIPCLYIHGGPGSGSYWLEQFSGSILEERFQMIYLDQRGVSRSGSPANHDFSLKRMLLDFEEVREALGIKKWLVLGHSFGAGIQTAYASEFPKVVKGMIMLNGTVNIAESLKGTVAYTKAKFPNADYKVADSISVSPLQRMFSCMQILGDDSYKLFYKHKASADSMNVLMGKISNWNYDFGNSVVNYPEYFQNFSPLTSRIKVPVLVFCGNMDYAIGPEHYKLIRFPKQMLVRVDVGHLPFQEAPDELENAIDGYLKKYF
jgi:proline iminopeptidase